MHSSPEPSLRQDSEVEVSDQEDSRREVEEASGDESMSSAGSASEAEQEVANRSPKRKQGSSDSEDEQRSSPPKRKRSSESGSEKSDDGPNLDEEHHQSGVSTKEDIFGSDSGSDDEGGQKQQDRQSSKSPSEKDDSDREESEGRSSPIVRRESQEYDDEDHVQREGEYEEQEKPPQEIRIDAEVPRMTPNLGSGMHFVKFPNFLSVDTHPYDPSWYEDEIDEDEHKDEEGKKRLKLKVENTIRWKSVPDDIGNVNRESNARMVKWSDGSLTLHLGSEIFDVHKNNLLQGENNHLFVRQGLGLQGQAVFRTKLSFRPHSTDSFTHRKMTLSLADKSSKTNKIRVLPNVGLDPEARRSEMVKKEEDKLKASIRRENKQRRTRERAIHRGPNAAYLEPDFEEEDEDGGISLSAIKSNYKSRVQDPGYGRAGNYSPDDSGDDSDFDLGKVKSEKKKARIVESDDE